MGEAKYTKGPWGNGASIAIRAIDTEIFGYSISYINTPHKGRRKEALANARLISAAPDLLEALQMSRAYIASRCGTPCPEDRFADQVLIEVHRLMDAAISKALGE